MNQRSFVMTSHRCWILAPAFGLFASIYAAVPALAVDPIRCTVVIDEESGDILHRKGSCDERTYPMSTFKLPLAMMGYDAGILTDETTPLWKYRKEFGGSARVQEDFNPTSWEKESIVWYSQEITRRLGEAKFEDYIQRFDYGNRDVSGGPGKDGLTGAWLMSSLTISADDQVDFIRRFLTERLPISDHAVEMTKNIVPRFEAADGWVIHGKTGSGWLRDKAGKRAKERPLGWFVGWAEKEDRRVVFARLFVSNRAHNEPLSFETRDTLIEDLPKIVAGL
jgi:beta-lactamase class D